MKIIKWIKEKIGLTVFCVVLMAIILVSTSTMIYLHQSTNYDDYDNYTYEPLSFSPPLNITFSRPQDAYLAISHYYNSSNNTFNIYDENNTLVYSGLYDETVRNISLNLDMTFGQFMYLCNSFSEPKTDIQDIYIQIIEQLKNTLLIEGVKE